MIVVLYCLAAWRTGLKYHFGQIVRLNVWSIWSKFIVRILQDQSKVPLGVNLDSEMAETNPTIIFHNNSLIYCTFYNKQYLKKKVFPPSVYNRPRSGREVGQSRAEVSIAFWNFLQAWSLPAKIRPLRSKVRSSWRVLPARPGVTSCLRGVGLKGSKIRLDFNKNNRYYFRSITPLWWVSKRSHDHAVNGNPRTLCSRIYLFSPRFTISVKLRYTSRSI